MREFKFRAYDPVYFIMEYNVNVNQGMPVKQGYQWIDLDNTIHGSKLMQYIGLKDKNGTEIYEGDIFEDYNGAKYVVEFDEDYGGFLPFTSEDGCGCCSTGMTGRDSESGTVIGNIYENPDWRLGD